MFSNRKFHFAFIPTIAYTVFTILLLSLGNWQLNRAAEKQALFDEFNHGLAVIELEQALDLPSPRYQHIRITGQFVNSKNYLLDNMVNSQSVPGKHVYTPFKTDAGQWIVVNRGWIARRSMDEPRHSLQQFLMTPSGSMTISGRLDTLRQPGLVLEAEIPSGAYPKTVQFPTFEQLANDLEQDLVPFQLLLDELEPATIGFLREWQPLEMGPQTHLGYAFQWFALALTLTIIYLILSFRKVTYE